MKKKMGIILGAGMGIVIVILGAVYVMKPRPQPADPVDPVDPKDKVVLSDQANLSRVSPPCLANDVLMVREMAESGENGYIVKGTITSEELTRVPFTGEGSAEFAQLYGDNLGTDYMVYDVDVDEIWFGDEVEETFTFKIMGDKNSVITKPNMGDEVIVFAYQTEGMDLPQLVDLEHSIFTNNGLLYSFSNTENLSSYDTKPDGTLKSDVEELMGKDMEELLRMARETE